MITKTFNIDEANINKRLDSFLSYILDDISRGLVQQLIEQGNVLVNDLQVKRIIHLLEKNLGTIKSSNLCTEIIEYTAPDEVAVCNLASIALPMFVKDGEFDHQTLFDVTVRVTKNLNIDLKSELEKTNR